MLHNRTWPAWINQTIYDEIEDVYTRGSYMLVKDLKMKRLRVGPMLEKMVERLVRAEDHWFSEYRQKMFIYSAQDTTIGGLLTVLGAVQPAVSAFSWAQFRVGSAIALEFSALCRVWVWSATALKLLICLVA